MKKLSFLIAVFIFLAANIFAQDLRKKAEENPLFCALYLLQKEGDLNALELSRLTQVFFELPKSEDLFYAINLAEENDDKAALFITYSREFLKIGKKTEANKFLTEAVKTLNKDNHPDVFYLKWAVEDLFSIERSDEAVKIAEIFADEFDSNDITTAVAEEFVKRGQTEKLRQFIAQPFFPHESENNLTRAKIALIYAKLKQPEKARKILEEIKQTAFFGETVTDENNNRREILFPILRVHLALGEIDKAFEVWNVRGDQDDFYENRLFIDDLIAYGQMDKVSLLLAQMQSNTEKFARDGYIVVEIYLKIGDVESALSAAKNMSDKDDNYWQQDSFMKLADRFIADGNTNYAESILDVAFGRANKIIFQHNAMDSVGASTGSRKMIYLGNIYQRLMKLRRFDKAFAVINSIGSDHWKAKEFIVEKLADFVSQQIKALPRKKINAILNKIQNIYDKEDEGDYDYSNTKLLVAGIYAEMGEKTKAVELIAKVLEEAKESCCYEDDFLIAAGKVFEQKKLKANANLKKVLKKYIEDAE
ncbi:MAG TPA: hypothetical protein PKE69_05650 [Pyrinomonadaceae bacterium]|nr:hypothetical protein [Pyrinomonadaceae bacterium]